MLSSYDPIYDGSLGNGSDERSSIPVVVTDLTDAIAIASGAESTCALLTDGEVSCWGDNTTGQLGIGTTEWAGWTLHQVPGLADVTAIASSDASVYAMLADGTVKAWGANRHGDLGDSTAVNHASPVPVSGIQNAVAITAGANHACALLSNGQVRCWGRNDYGQLGDGTTENRSTPVNVVVP